MFIRSVLFRWYMPISNQSDFCAKEKLSAIVNYFTQNYDKFQTVSEVCIRHQVALVP